jgi:pimeloyl-ACP methyl ester carboxylesterase
MAAYRDRWITANGIEQHYLEWGDPAAPPLVLLHGTTSNAHSWDDVSDALADRFHIYALDCRDHGDSATTSGEVVRDVLWEDVAATVDGLGLGRFNLMGLSMGGRTSMNYAARFSDRLIRLVVEDIGPETPAAASSRVMGIIRSVPAVLPTMDDVVEWLRPMRPYADEAFLRRKAHFSVHPAREGGWQNKFRQTPYAGGAAAPANMWDLVVQISCPTLVVRGDESDILTDDIMARMCAALPDCRGATVSRAGHAVHEDNAAEFISVVRPFLLGE